MNPVNVSGARYFARRGPFKNASTRCCLSGAAAVALAFVIAGFLSACSNPSSAVDSVILGTSPDNGAVKVGVLSKIESTFSTEIDGDSVNSATVELTMTDCIPDAGCSQFPFNHARGTQPRCAGCHSSSFQPGAVSEDTAEFFAQRDVSPVKGVLSYDPDRRTVAFSADLPLARSARYQFTLTGLRDANGAMIAPVSLQFATNYDPWIRKVHYSKGAVTGLTQRELDTLGLPARTTRFADQGPDAIWFTADDTPELYFVDTYNTEALRSRRVIYESAGIDNIWYTSDDPPSSYFAYTTDNHRLVRVAAYTDPGLDGAWFSLDDQVSVYTLYEYDGAGRITRFGTFINPGTDGEWFTQDDVPDSFGVTVVQLDAFGRESSTFVYSNAGDDGQWSSADDVILSRYETTYDTSGSVVTRTQFFGPGSDSQWLTSDDTVLQYYKTTRNAAGWIDSMYLYQSSGNDQQWFTPDDVYGPRVLSTFNGNIEPVRSVSYGAVYVGMPPYLGVAPNPLPSNYTENIFDARHLRVKRLQIDAPGSDETWFNADDGIASITNSTFDVNGTRNTTTQLNSPGLDGLWDTSDDEVADLTVYAADGCE